MPHASAVSLFARRRRNPSVWLWLPVLLTTSLVVSACGMADGQAAAPASPVPIAVTATPAVERPIARYVRVSGTLTADEQADVAAETNGRIVDTPVERGTAVTDGAPLVRIAPAQARAQLDEAQANVAQTEAKLAFTPTGALDVEQVPGVANARASLDLARTNFARAERLHAAKLLSQSDYDQTRTQLDAAEQQYQGARNTAAQDFQSLQAARARLVLSRKAVADTTVRAPFTGLVAERLVSVGDYVTVGTKVAVVVRNNPLRLELTVPEQLIAQVAVGAPVTFEVDAYRGRTFTGTIRFVSPSLQSTQRALTVEAIVPNADGALKPGLFATARVRQPADTQGLLVPEAAIQVTAGTSRVFVVRDDHVEERIVTPGQAVEALREITSGLAPGDRVVTSNVARLSDGAKVTVGGAR